MGERRGSRPKFSISESSDSSCYTLDTQYTDLDEERDNISTLPMLKRTVSNATTNYTNTSCSNYQKCEQVLKSYTKLKIYFTVLCVVNILIIILVCVFFAVFFMRFSDKTDLNSAFDLGVGTDKEEAEIKTRIPNSEGLHTGNEHPSRHVKCASLEHKLNWSSKPTSTHCSFDDFIDAVKEYVNPEKQVIHMVSGIPDTNGKNTREHNIVNWEKKTPKSDSASKVHSIDHNADRGTVIINRDGFYFVYSRLAFSIKSPDKTYSANPILAAMDIHHSIRRKQLKHSSFEILQTTAIKCSNTSFVHGSYLERVVYLKSGDELKVVVSHAGSLQFNKQYKGDNYFGAFLL